MKLIFFDMDGVLTPTMHCILLAEMVNKEDELYEIIRKASDGTDNMGLEWIIKGIAKMLNGVPESLLEDAGRRLPIMEGAVETIKTLKNSGYTPILITSGIEQVAGVFARRLQITEWYGNTLEIKNGKTTGHLYASLLVELHSKGDVVRKIVAQRSSKTESVAVGNDVNDWPMFEEVGFSILFNPSPNLKDHLKWCFDRAEKGFTKEYVCPQSVDVVIEEPDLQLLLPLLVPEPYSLHINVINQFT